MRRLGFALGLAVLAVGCGGSGGSGGASGGGAAAKEGPTVAMMPKNKGNPYFVSCHKGGQEAADQLGVKLLWTGRRRRTRPSRTRSWRPGSRAAWTSSR
jgi:ABC-type sugar transport system substrate-binding protein